MCLFVPLQAIESFAVTVKDIAQMLQGFGTELAETEMPDEGKAIEYLLESHTDKYKKLKVRFQMFSFEMHCPYGINLQFFLQKDLVVFFKYYFECCSFMM